jgi:hypothetical protein
MKRVLITALLLIVACKKAETPPPAAAAPAPGSPAWKVANARSAAPAQIAMNATVLDGVVYDSVPGATLAAGDNGWTCYASDPRTEADDPVCLDEQGMAFERAWLAHQTPHLTGMGIAYLLKGGVSPSDTDPFKMAPDSGQPWIQEPPQIGIAMPSARSYTGLPTRRRPDGPWVKFAGTPYAYIVIPSR